MASYMSKLERNLHTIRQSPQARQDFENLMAAFVQTHGEPDEEDLEAIVHVVLTEQLWWYAPMCYTVFLVCVALVIGIIVKGFIIHVIQG